MSSRRIMQTLTVSASLAVITCLISGCFPLLAFAWFWPALSAPPAALTYTTVLDAKPDRLLLAHSDFSEIDGAGPLSPPPQDELRADVLAVDLQTLATQTLLSDVQADPYWMRSDGRWVAWLAFDEGAVLARDLGTGAERRFFQDSGETSGLLNRVILHALDDGRLVVQLRRGAGTASSLVVVIDLESGEQIATENADAEPWHDFVALSGDYLALRRYPPFDPNMQSPAEFAGAQNIDVIDLSTGERRTLVTDVRPGGGGLYIHAGRVFWGELSDAELLDRVRSVEIDSGQVRTDATFDGVRDLLWLDTGDPGLLLQEQIVQAQRYLLCAFEGGQTTLLEVADSLLNTAHFSTLGCTTGDRVIVRDQQTGEFVLFGADLQEQRRFTPFANWWAGRSRAARPR